jgi:tRNA A37 threonylcarbamoyladenosine dehydratase
VIDLSYENRFGGLERLYGVGVLPRLNSAHVMVVGVGGVGSWTVEALARSAVGTLTLVDLDDVCATNTNRQMHALDPQWGRLKGEVLADRVKLINPGVDVRFRADFFTRKSATALLEPRPDLVIDAIDSVGDKVALAEACLARGIPLITSGGAGGKTDPTKVRWADLANEQGDQLLKAVKRGLRDQGLGPEGAGPWGIECVYSLEPSVLPWEVCSTVAAPDAGGSGRIDCATGFGAASFATGTFGFVLASRAVFRLLHR